ncbi:MULTISPECIES: MFS transporter [unclassified Nocardioides]|jgi:EmrB/QacA subfamily drug resistance transporter|uniref:MFS transporter n=1 Tax=unclassified Nocardioides TaxID=2615069 RepID=UPI0007025CE8|nr:MULTISPECIES: MFS transporter [unclassified Nocardioides]KRC50025.1 MFS transporter [Nocardioides sp. Root79]KRC75493.1 MFS transporter [Nocardioides sp. Root240]
MSTQSQTPRVGLVTALLTGATFLAGLDLFIVNVAFDDIGRDFAADGTPPTLGQLSWILNGYAVVFAALLIPMGRLTDRYGRRTGFVAGVVVFAAASLACGFADDVWTLVAFRVLQAVGAAAMTPASLGLLLGALPPEKRAAGARLWALASAVAAALGPAAGGVLVQVSWHWAFWINVPIGAALALASLRFVPDVRHNEGAPHPDLAGAALIAGGIGALILGLVQGNDWGWTSPGVLGSFAAAVLLVSGFVAVSARHTAPVIDPALLRIRPVRWANLAALAFNTAFGSSLLLGILWMQNAWDYSALRTGLAVAAGPVMVPVASLLAARLLPRVRPGRLIAAGSIAFGVAALWQSMVISTDPSYLTTFLPGWLLGGVGVGLAMPNLVAAATSALPPEQASTGSGLSSMARQVGLALGVSILVGLLGSGPLTLDDVRSGWVFIAIASGIAALVAVAIEGVRAPARAIVPEPVA